MCMYIIFNFFGFEQKGPLEYTCIHCVHKKVQNKAELHDCISQFYLFLCRSSNPFHVKKLPSIELDTWEAEVVLSDWSHFKVTYIFYTFSMKVFWGKGWVNHDLDLPLNITSAMSSPWSSIMERMSSVLSNSSPWEIGKVTMNSKL